MQQQEDLIFIPTEEEVCKIFKEDFPNRSLRFSFSDEKLLECSNKKT